MIYNLFRLLEYLDLLGIAILFCAVLLPNAALPILALGVFVLGVVAWHRRLAQQTLIEITLRPTVSGVERIERSHVLAAQAGLAQLETVFQQAGLTMQLQQITDLRAHGLAFVCEDCEDVLGILQDGGRLIAATLNWPGAIRLAAYTNREVVTCGLLTDVSLRSRVFINPAALRPALASLETGLLAADPFLKRASLRELIYTLTWYTAPVFTAVEEENLQQWATAEQGTIEVRLDDAGKNRLALDSESHATYIAYRFRWVALENRLLERLLQDRIQWRQVVRRPARWSLALRRRRARARQLNRMIDWVSKLPQEDLAQFLAELPQGKAK